MSNYNRTNNAYQQQWNPVHGLHNEYMGARNDLAWNVNQARPNNYPPINQNAYANKEMVQNYSPVVNKNLMPYNQKDETNIVNVKNVVPNNNKEIDLSKKVNEKVIPEKKIIDSKIETQQTPNLSIVKVEMSDPEEDPAFDSSQLNEVPKYNENIETATNRAYENFTQVYNNAVAHLPIGCSKIIESGPDTLKFKSLLSHVAEMVAQKSQMEQKKPTKSICSQTEIPQCHKSTQTLIQPDPNTNTNQYGTTPELQNKCYQTYANRYQQNVHSMNQNHRAYGDQVREQYYDNRGVYMNPGVVMQRQEAVENVVPQRMHAELPNVAPMLVHGAEAVQGRSGSYRPHGDYSAGTPVMPGHPYYQQDNKTNQLQTRKRNYYQSNYPTRAQYPQYGTAQNFDINFTNNVNNYQTYAGNYDQYTNY